MTNTLSVIYHSKQQVDLYPSTAADEGSPERDVQYLLSKIINSIDSQMEISAMMAAASLLGMPAKMSSHTFWFCFIWPAVRYLKSKIQVSDCYESEDDEDFGSDYSALDDFEDEDIFDENVISKGKGEGCCQLGRNFNSSFEGVLEENILPKSEVFTWI
jgi:hypothetical protein